MRGLAIVIKPGVGGHGERVDLTGKSPPEIAHFLHQTVGGFIERVPHFDRLDGQVCVAFCNEDGRRLGLAPNDVATMMWATAIGFRAIRGGIPAGPVDLLLGPVVIVTGDRAFMRAL